MIKFKVLSGQYGKCEVVEMPILKETEHYYVVNPGKISFRELKVSKDYKYFDDKEKALEFAVSELEGREAFARKNLREIVKAEESAISELNKIKLDKQTGEKK